MKSFQLLQNKMLKDGSLEGEWVPTMPGFEFFNIIAAKQSLDEATYGKNYLHINDGIIEATPIFNAPDYKYVYKLAE